MDLFSLLIGFSAGALLTAVAMKSLRSLPHPREETGPQMEDDALNGGRATLPHEDPKSD